MKKKTFGVHLIFNERVFGYLDHTWTPLVNFTKSENKKENQTLGSTYKNNNGR
jgi:hypothetical protein